MWSHHSIAIFEDLHWLPVSQRDGLQNGLEDLEVYPRCCPCLPQRLLMLSPRLMDKTWALHPVELHTCSPRSDCGGTAKFRRQWTDHLKQSAACTTSTSAVTERLHTSTVNAPVLATTRHCWDAHMRFRRRIQIHWLTYLFTYLLAYLLIYRVSMNKLNQKRWQSRCFATWGGPTPRQSRQDFFQGWANRGLRWSPSGDHE